MVYNTLSSIEFMAFNMLNHCNFIFLKAFFYPTIIFIFAGTVGTGKAILYDVSDNSNQAVGMSFMAIAWACGLIIGPLIGGNHTQLYFIHFECLVECRSK